MVELSASSVVCRAICAIRLTTLPIAAEDLAQAVDIGARLLRRGAGLVGELAGLADLRADPVGGLGELVGGLGEGGGGRLRGIGPAGQRVGAQADIGERGCEWPRRRRRLNWLARSSWRIIAPTSSSSSSRISLAESPSAAGDGSELTASCEREGLARRRGRIRETLPK